MRPRRIWLLTSPLPLLIAGWGLFEYHSSREKRYRAGTSARRKPTWPPVGLLMRVDAASRDLVARRSGRRRGRLLSRALRRSTQRQPGRTGGMGASARRFAVRNESRRGTRGLAA